MNDYKKPETWGVPAGLANRLGEIMEQKPQDNPLVDLMEALGQAAGEIADLEPDPESWAGWITYLLDALQVQAEKDSKPAAFEAMLQILKSDLETRIEGGKW
jgi:hypothetical protein